METTRLEEIRKELSEELAKLNQNYKVLRKGLEKAEKERDRVKEVVDMLSGSGKKKSSTKGNSSPSKGTPSPDNALPVMTTILEENDSLTRSELQGLTMDKLKEQGFALTGFTQRFAKMLEDPRFQMQGDNISLEKVPA